MTNKTALYEQHEAAGGKIVDFHGWLLPLHYGSQLDEHHQVRQDAGMFDVSHMVVSDIKGTKAEAFLRHLLANDVAKLKENGRALYTAMLNEQGGIIDDLIVYKIDADFFRLVTNAATKAKDLAWIEKHAADFNVTVDVWQDYVNLAVQGPNAREKAVKALPETLRERALALKPFAFVTDGNWQVARTGYTGEDGFEILLPASHADEFWQALLQQGVKPCGLGARDTLRLEAGLNLYGSDMDENITPYEANIAWTVALQPEDRDFIGRKVLEAKKAKGGYAQLVGLLLLDKGVLRAGQKVYSNDEEVGEIVSGGFSPTLKQSIAFARVLSSAEAKCFVEIRGKRLHAQIVKMPFVRHGEAVYQLK